MWKKHQTLWNTLKLLTIEKVLNNQTLSLWIIYVERLIVY